MPDKPLTEVVRDFRLALGDTQQSFAARLNLAISTVVRYESTRPPKGKALSQFYKAAVKERRYDFAEAFAGALAREIGALVSFALMRVPLADARLVSRDLRVLFGESPVEMSRDSAIEIGRRALENAEKVVAEMERIERANPYAP
jgi:transcriptional regulator with XRE-family HTH domain